MERETIVQLIKEEKKVRVILKNGYSYEGKFISIASPNKENESLCYLNDKKGEVCFFNTEISAIIGNSYPKLNGDAQWKN